MTDSPRSTTDAWTALQTVEGWAGEIRVNLLRLLALVLFYGHHFVRFTVLSDPEITAVYFSRVSLLVVAWATAAAIAHVALKRRAGGVALPHALVVGDALMISLLIIAGESAQTRMFGFYYLVIASTPLRLNLGLVYTAVVATGLGYLSTVAHYAFVVIGSERYYQSAELRIARSDQLFFVLTLLFAGLLAGQVVRQMRRIVVGYGAVDRGEPTAADLQE